MALTGVNGLPVALDSLKCCIHEKTLKKLFRPIDTGASSYFNNSKKLWLQLSHVSQRQSATGFDFAE